MNLSRAKNLLLLLLLSIPVLYFFARSLTWEQGPHGCDSFGYLYSAKSPFIPVFDHQDVT